MKSDTNESTLVYGRGFVAGMFAGIAFAWFLRLVMQ